MKTPLAERLGSLRKERHLRQEDVASALGIATLTYQRYEYGDRDPQSAVICALADFYQVSADYLLGRSEER